MFLGQTVCTDLCTDLYITDGHIMERTRHTLVVYVERWWGGGARMNKTSSPRFLYILLYTFVWAVVGGW